MLPPLRDETRRTLLAIVLLIGTSSALLLPLTAQSSLEAQAQAESAGDEPSVPSIPAGPEYRDFSVTRDPFVADGDMSSRPEDRGTRGEETSGIVVRAVILGPQSRALVERSGRVGILGVGDRIGDVRIVRIDRAGLLLSDGRTIAVEGSR